MRFGMKTMLLAFSMVSHPKGGVLAQNRAFSMVSIVLGRCVLDPKGGVLAQSPAFSWFL